MSALDQAPGWVSFGATALGAGGIGAGVRPILDYLRGRRQQSDGVAMGLVEKLQTRIDRLEESSSSERQLCDAKLDTVRAELALVHGNFEALLLAIEIAPEKAAEVVAKIKARRPLAAANG